jgi:hypothetical protein
MSLKRLSKRSTSGPSCRPCRPPTHEAEHKALAVLATEMAENPRNMLQKLVEMAVALQRGYGRDQHIGRQCFRWESLAGVCASRRNNPMSPTRPVRSLHRSEELVPKPGLATSASHQTRSV